MPERRLCTLAGHLVRLKSRAGTQANTLSALIQPPGETGEDRKSKVIVPFLYGRIRFHSLKKACSGSPSAA